MNCLASDKYRPLVSPPVVVREFREETGGPRESYEETRAPCSTLDEV
jgi:hypothetical protein